jgi:hypothetical protein
MHLYVDQYYSVEKFQAAYHGSIQHITNRNQWPIVDKGFKLLPPIITDEKGLGRTKKNRFLTPQERRKRTRHVQCQGCKQYGHRQSSWRCPRTGIKKMLPAFLFTFAHMFIYFYPITMFDDRTWKTKEGQDSRR